MKSRTYDDINEYYRAVPLALKTKVKELAYQWALQFLKAEDRNATDYVYDLGNVIYECWRLTLAFPVTLALFRAALARIDADFVLEDV